METIYFMNACEILSTEDHRVSPSKRWVVQNIDQQFFPQQGVPRDRPDSIHSMTSVDLFRSYLYRMAL